MGCAPRPAWIDASFEGHPIRLSIDEIEERVRVKFPQMSRAALRSLLHRAARKGNVTRVSRGLYEESSDYDRALMARLAVSARWTKEREEKWEQRTRAKELRNFNVLLSHYLLSHIPAYRKARMLGLSEHTYFYALNAALGWLQTMDLTPTG